MSNNNAQLEVKYNKICSIAMMNIFTTTKNTERIVFRNFDMNNKDHLFLLSVAKALTSVDGRTIAVETSIWKLRKLNKIISGLVKKYNIKKAKKKELKAAIDTVEMLDFMIAESKKICGEDFTYADIYDEFYAKKGE